MFLISLGFFIVCFKHIQRFVNNGDHDMFYDSRGFPDSSDGNESPRGSGFDPWIGQILWRREWQPIPIFLPGEFHGQRSLVGYSLWGCKESDTTEATNTHIYSYIQDPQEEDRCESWFWLQVLRCLPRMDGFCHLYKGYWSRALWLLQERTSSLVPTASLPWENVCLCHTIRCLALDALCAFPRQFDVREGNLQAFWNPWNRDIFQLQLHHNPKRGLKYRITHTAMLKKNVGGAKGVPWRTHGSAAVKHRSG